MRKLGVVMVSHSEWGVVKNWAVAVVATNGRSARA
jgi:hypothetical protein